MGTMLAPRLVRVADQRPPERLVRLRWLATLVRAAADLAHGTLHERPARLRRTVRVVDARLPTVVVGLVGDVEDQEAAHGRLACGHLQRLVVVGGLHALAD